MNEPTQQTAENKMRIEQFKIKKLMNRLANAQTNGTSAISLIIPPKKTVTDTTKMLTEEFGKASNIQDRVNRQSVERAITSVRERLKLYNKAPPNGLVLYCGSMLEADGKTERKVMIDFEPYKPINTSKYFCDSKFHVEDLESLLEVDQQFGFIIMDGHGCLYGKLQGNNKEILAKFSVDLPKKHGRGGQSSVRFARLRKEKRHNYVRKVCEVAASCFIQNDKVNCVGIVVAGSADFKNELVESPLFDQRMQKLVITVVDVSYGGENGLQQAIELSSQSLSNVKYMQEKKTISKFFEEIAIDTGKYVYGIQDTMRMLEAGSMETVLVYEQLEAFRVTLKNKETGILSYTYLRPDQINEAKHYQDPLTKQEVYESIEQASLTEWLAENYAQFGCNLQFVTDKSPEGFQFVKGFAGIGGFLRFKMEIDFLHQAEQAGNKLDDDDDFI